MICERCTTRWTSSIRPFSAICSRNFKFSISKSTQLSYRQRPLSTSSSTSCTPKSWKDGAFNRHRRRNHRVHLLVRPRLAPYAIPTHGGSQRHREWDYLQAVETTAMVRLSRLLSEATAYAIASMSRNYRIKSTTSQSRSSRCKIVRMDKRQTAVRTLYGTHGRQAQGARRDRRVRLLARPWVHLLVLPQIPQRRHFQTSPCLSICAKASAALVTKTDRCLT